MATGSVIEEGIAPDGRPWVQPADRAAWRAWLEEHHATSSGVWLASWRRASGREPRPYETSIEEPLCFGWIDSKAGTMDADRSGLWCSPRRPRSGWSRSNKERVERLIAADLMTPAGLAAIEEAKRPRNLRPRNLRLSRLLAVTPPVG